MTPRRPRPYSPAQMPAGFDWLTQVIIPISLAALFGGVSFVAAATVGVIAWFFQRHQSRADATEERTRQLELGLADVKAECRAQTATLADVKATTAEILGMLAGARSVRRGRGAALVVLALASAVLLSSACASARRPVTVSIVSAHSALALVQDTESLLVCGRDSAPPAGQCVPLTTHRLISARLAEGFRLTGDAARLARAVPATSPTPHDALSLTAAASRLLRDVLALIPQSDARTALLQRLEGY